METIPRGRAVAASAGARFNLVSHCYIGRRDSLVLEALRIFYPRQAELILDRLKSGVPVRVGMAGVMDMRLRMSALAAQGFKVTVDA